MKILRNFIMFFVLACCLIVTQAKAQTIIFSEDFEIGQIPAGWFSADLDNKVANQGVYGGDNSNTPWIPFNEPTPANPDNIALAATSWFNPLNCCANDWLITPSIDVPASGAVFLSWDFKQGQQEWPDGYKVIISTSGGTIEDFANNPDDLFSIEYTGDVIFDASSGCSATPGSCCQSNDPNINLNCCTTSYWNDHCNGLVNYADSWGSELRNLSAYAGQTIHIAFHHDANDQVAIVIDNIQVFSPVEDELSIGNSIWPSPFGFIPLDQASPMNFSTKAINNGSNTQSNVKLAVTVNEWSNTTPVQVYYNDGTAGQIGSLIGGAISDISNGSTWTPTDTGTYEVIYHLTSTGADGNTENNEAKFYYYVNDFDGLGFMSRQMIFSIETVDGLIEVNSGGYLGFEIWNGGNAISSGSMSYPLTFTSETSILGLIPQLTVGAGDGYDPSTVLYFEILDGPITVSTGTQPNVLATSGPMTDLSLDIGVQINFDCPVHVMPDSTVYVAVRQEGAGSMGLIVWDNYFDSGVVNVVVDDILRGSIGTPGIIAITGNIGTLEGLAIISDISGQQVTLSATADSGALCDASWDFGDGMSDTGLEVTHVYQNPGEYEICLTVDGTITCTTVNVSCNLSLNVVSTAVSTAEVDALNGADPVSYEWVLNGNVVSTNNPATGLSPETTYTVNATDAGGCTATLSVTTTSCALQVSISQPSSNNLLATQTGAQGSSFFVWTDGLGNQVSNQPFINNVSPGVYTVTITDSANCTATASYVVTGIQDILMIDNFNLFPNPVSSQFNINLSLKESADVMIELLSLDGKLVKKVYSAKTNLVNEAISVKDISSGVYLVKVSINNESFSERLFVN